MNNIYMPPAFIGKEEIEALPHRPEHYLPEWPGLLAIRD